MSQSSISSSVFTPISTWILTQRLKFFSKELKAIEYFEKFKLYQVESECEADVIIGPEAVNSEDTSVDHLLLTFTIQWLNDLLKGRIVQDDSLATPFLTLDQDYRPVVVKTIPDAFGPGRTVGVALPENSHEYRVVMQILSITGATVADGGSLAATYCIRKSGIGNEEKAQLKEIYPNASLIRINNLINAVIGESEDPIFETLEPSNPIKIHKNLIPDILLTCHVQRLRGYIVEKLKNMEYVHYFPITLPSVFPRSLRPIINEHVLVFQTAHLDNVKIFEHLERAPNLKIYGLPEIVASWETESPMLCAYSYHSNETSARREQKAVHELVRDVLLERIYGAFLIPTESKTQLCLQTIDKCVVETTVTALSPTRYCTALTLNTNLLSFLKQMMIEYGSSPCNVFKKSTSEEFRQEEHDWAFKINTRDPDAQILRFRNGVLVSIKPTVSSDIVDKFARINVSSMFLRNGLQKAVSSSINASVNDKGIVQKSADDKINLVCSCTSHLNQLLDQKMYFCPRWFNLAKSKSNLRCYLCDSSDSLVIILINNFVTNLDY